MQHRHEVIVVGLGAVGSATLYQLARRGVKALGIDRFQPPHDRGSSHGESRVTRLALGEGGHYVQFVRRSHEIWRTLEAATGRTLLQSVGGLIFGSQTSGGAAHGAADFLETTIAVAHEHGIDHEILDANALAGRFPQFRFRGDETGYYEPEAGYLLPEACVAAQLDEACRLGAEIRTNERVVRSEALKQSVRIETDRGSCESDRLVVCAGPWLPQMISALGGRARPFRQVMFWFEPDGSGDLFHPERMPVYIRLPDSRSEMFYGFPLLSHNNSAMKLAGEQFDRPCDPDNLNREVSEDEKQAMHWLAAPHVRISSRCVRTVACQYTVTPDFGFIIDHVPDSDRVWFASACSGHGFKHSAAVGEALAGLATEGRCAFDLSRFNLERLLG